MQLIQSAMDGGHRMLLFSQFTSMLAILQDKLEKEGIPYYIITGETSKQNLAEQIISGDMGQLGSMSREDILKLL